MKRQGIARYVGNWISSSGHRLVIKKVNSAQARVDYLDATGNPVRRPFMDNAPAVEMIANYNDYNDTFDVELWERGKNFVLDLTHEQAYDLDEQKRESLVPGLITNEGDRYLQRYFELFPLRHFVRAQHRADHRESLKMEQSGCCLKDSGNLFLEGIQSFEEELKFLINQLHAESVGLE